MSNTRTELAQYSGAGARDGRAERDAAKPAHDLTQGPILRLILGLALPSMISMSAQIAYQLVDVYFVAQLGTAATAGVNAAANTVWFVNAVIQILSVATMTLVSHAAGRRDPASANLAFNQGLLMAAVCAALFLIGAMAGARLYLGAVLTDPQTLEAGVAFLHSALPGFALTLPLGVASAGLRGTGIVKPSVAVYTGTVVLNMLLAPILIGGWGTGVSFGVQGAGWATTISVLLGTTGLAIYIYTSGAYVKLDPKLLRPRLAEGRRILRIGLPAGGEFALLFLQSVIVYTALQNLGPSAQAGFGIGSRVLQAILLPAVAVSFAARPIVGQNFGARDMQRVREVFQKLVLVEIVITLMLFVIVRTQALHLMRFFDAGPESSAVGVSFLQTMSYGLLFQGLIYVCMTMFQGLGQTLLSLLCSTLRFVPLAAGALMLSRRSDFEVTQLWMLLVGAMALHALVGLVLLRRSINTLRSCSLQTAHR